METRNQPQESENQLTLVNTVDVAAKEAESTPTRSIKKTTTSGISKEKKKKKHEQTKRGDLKNQKGKSASLLTSHEDAEDSLLCFKNLNSASLGGEDTMKRQKVPSRSRGGLFYDNDLFGCYPYVGRSSPNFSNSSTSTCVSPNDDQDKSKKYAEIVNKSEKSYLALAPADPFEGMIPQLSGSSQVNVPGELSPRRVHEQLHHRELDENDYHLLLALDTSLETQNQQQNVGPITWKKNSELLTWQYRKQNQKRDRLIAQGFGKKIEELEEKYDVCAICLDRFKEGQSVKLLPCDHFFHRPCVEKWMASKGVCPIDKRQI
eukprot:CAMPEP_0115006336 /NCGR_PEP_ID=MMETSP0216-20121206/20439_1 /TAXON_ID=223996 /ORGANISM="Protocruzia adherens, Strain Boccale" /LENGTH=318 /DNA_ID=CAMNT_0002372899 /DNA_START=286 /DNA_END=1242 /DNA_ORIENTATION=-